MIKKLEGKRKRNLFIFIFFIVLLIIVPPFAAPSIHNGSSQASAIRAELAKSGHPYQSFLAIIKHNGADKLYGDRYDVSWFDFNSETGATPTIFYVKKKQDRYYVDSAGTGP